MEARKKEKGKRKKDKGGWNAPAVRSFFLLPFSFCLVVSVGCSSRRPLEAWRQEVTRFVAFEGNGDPDCLRDTTDLRSRRATRPAPLTISSILGADTRSRDARGVLIGQCKVDDNVWYVFLVGIIDVKRGESELESVRPVAFTADAEGLHWYTPRPDDKVPTAYLEASKRQKDALATSYAAFPGPKDVFEMQTQGDSVTIVDRNSGARWDLQVPASLGRTTDQDRRPSGVVATSSTGSSTEIR